VDAAVGIVFPPQSFMEVGGSLKDLERGHKSAPRFDYTPARVVPGELRWGAALEA
jgi:hypothetical protein